MRNLLFSVAACLLAPAFARGAAPEIPARDVPGAKDPAVAGRFAGSVILSQASLDYDALTLPLGPLEKVKPPQRDNHNNSLVAPAKSRKVEGRHTRLVYLLPEGTSPLQVLRNYQNAVAGKGGKTLFECSEADCGGGTKSLVGGGSTQSLAQYLWNQDRLSDKPTSIAYCAQNGKVGDMRYAAMEAPGLYLSLHAYQLSRSYCKTLDNRTLAVVDVIEGAAMEQKMVVVGAEEMAKAIDAEGRVALYGIHFDTGKSDIKPESEAALEQIARLLAQNRGLKLLVVGHTDNAGGYAGNLDLSRRRAEAVVSALAGRHKADQRRLQGLGVSCASPVASNASEEGRARNRRVELVAVN